MCNVKEKVRYVILWPRAGRITEKVPVLREVSMPMHTTSDQDMTGYAKFEAVNAATLPH